MTSLIQPSLSGGELAPSLHARVDLAKYQTGLKTCLNTITMAHGGASNRPGFQYICEVKDSSKAVRLIPFEFSSGSTIGQTYILEFGNLYMRVIKDGGQVLEANKTISGATQANPVVVTATSHGYTNGEEVFISGVVGMSELNGKNYKVAGVTTHTFQLQDMTSTNVNGTGYTAYSSAGTAARVFTLTTPYTEAQLFRLKYAQSADVLTVCHPSHAPRDITRTDHAAWTISTITFAPTQAAPTSLSGTANSTGSETEKYKVTAFNDETGEESLPSAIVTISNSHETKDNTISWTGATDADSYNVYCAKNNLYGFIGSTDTTTFTDDNIDPDTTDTPPKDRNPFDGSDKYPQTVTYFEQRKVFASTNNKPQTLYFSKSANYHNMTHSSPRKDDDAITRTIASLKVNEVRHLVPLSDLMVLSSGAEWRLTAGSNDVITPTSIMIKPQEYHGVSHVRPIIIGGTVIYVQAMDSIVRDLAYKLESDGYQGTDVSVLANHLFEGYTIVDWGYAEIPNSIIWAVRSDGTLLGLTYMREHEIWAWHRHETTGTFESVAVVEEQNVNGTSANEDAVYVLVNRTIGSTTKRFIERLHTRSFTDVMDAFFVDSGLTLDSPVAITGATQANPVVITAASHGLENGDICDISDVTGMTEINNVGWKVANKTTNTFQLQDSNGTNVNGTSYTAYASGGKVRKAVTSITGLDHLNGESVVALANGNVVTGLTVSNGAITLPNAASRVHVGLSYNADIETLNIEAPSTSGTVQGKFKRVSELTIRVEKTRGLQGGPDSTRLREFQQGINDLTTGDIAMHLRPSWNTNGRVFIRQANPLPMTVLAIMPEVTFE